MVCAVTRWCACRVRLEQGGRVLHEDPDSRVRIEEGSILVAYMDEDGPVVLEGRETTAGRFELTARSRPRRATLAFAGNRKHLAGEWNERGSCGGWRIELSDDAEG
jgi:hypothetical protein